MTATRDFTDEDLTAFIDGELDAQTTASLKQALKSDQALKLRLNQLESATTGLPEAFDGLLAAAPGLPDLPKEQPARPAWQVPAGLAAALALGIFLGAQFVAAPKPGKDWMAYVAAYQRLYVPETLTSVALSDEGRAAQLARLGAKLETDLSTVANIRQLDFTRGQLLGFEDRAIVQLAFLSPSGAPLALCIVKSENPVERDLEVSEMEGLKSAIWAKGAHAYLLIGGSDADLIESAAKEFIGAL